METIVNYFSDMPTIHRSLLLAGGLSLFLIIEYIIPFFKTHYNKWQHAGVNIFFTLTTVLVNFMLAFILIQTSIWATENQFGLLQYFEMPLLWMAILGLLLMDFIGAWLIHYIEHKVKILWQFHLVHHSDQHIDTTTANRHHPGESVLRFVFTMLAIAVVGAPIWLIFLYQSSSLVATQFSHSNIKIPKVVDGILKLIIVTPAMHRVHHHYRQPYTDTNFGNIFSIWDRIFGTYVEVENSKLVFGLDTYMENEESADILKLLTAPFRKYRKSLSYDKKEHFDE